jgi:Tfp pilus assembly protein PilF
MTAKSRRQQLEEMLAETPDDSFLRYGLAMDYLSAGEDEAALTRFRELLEKDPEYVPAYLQAGQLLARLGRESEARTVYQSGIAVARRTGEIHAASEMEGLLGMLE